MRKKTDWVDKSMKLTLVLTLALVPTFFTAGGVGPGYPSPVCGESLKENTPVTPGHVAQALIRTSQPVARNFVLLAPWMGQVQSQASVKLLALEPGRVDAIEAKDEAPVHAGALIMTFGGVRVQSEITKLKNQINSLESQVQLAGRTLVRLRQNLKEELSTQDDVAAAKGTEIKLQNQLNDTRLDLESLESRLRISAPISGTFTNRLVSIGQAVNAGDMLGEIVDTRHLRIVASLFPPADAHLEGKGVTVRITQTLTLSGSVSRVLPRASSTGAVLIWIEGKEIDEKLRPGESVSGDLILENRAGVLAVPESALIYGPEERPYVFILEKGSYLKRSVQTGLIQNGWAEILSGIERDQTVVTEGAYEIFYRDFNRVYKVED